MKIRDKSILDKFQNINGKMFVNLKEEDLKNYKFKFGEIKKLSNYLNVIRTIITKEICKFLQNKFQISKDTIELIQNSGITWDELYKFTEDEYEAYSIEGETKTKIQEYISEKRRKKKKKKKPTKKIIQFIKFIN